MTPVLIALSAGFALLYAAVPLAAPADALVKTVPVALLALAGARAGVPRPVWLGLALGALGDFLLARPGAASFMAGMAAFAAGHLAYVAGFGRGRAPVWLAAALAGLAVSTEFWLAPQAGALVWPVRGYVLVICLMAWRAGARHDPVLWAGAAAFLISDLMLALRLFVLAPGSAAAPALSLAVWAAYWLGQTLILAAFLPRPPAAATR